MAFLRFVVSHPHPSSGVENGLFALAYSLRNADEISEEHRRTLQTLLQWFEERLPTPKRFNRSSSKGHYRRNTKGIAWFRDTADKHISGMYQIKRIAEANGHSVDVIREERVGYIVYQDEVQVIAEPYADTRTGP